MPAGDWLPQTVTWWETWADSYQSRNFTPTAWQRLSMLVFLVDQYFGKPTKALLAEIRVNESALGATPADMQRLRCKVEEPPKQLARSRRFDRLKWEDD